MPADKENKLFLLVLLLLIATRGLTLFTPILAIDESIYAIFGDEMLRGAIPYRDLVDYKAPLIFYLYEFCFWLGGPGNMALVHLAHMIAVGLLCSILFQIGKAIAGRSTGWFCAIFYAIFNCAFTSHQVWATNAEPLMVLPLSAAALCLIQAERKPNRAMHFGGGVFLSLAFLIKYTSGINLALTLGYLLTRDIFFKDHDLPKKTLMQTLLQIILWCGGFTIPILLTGFYFYQQGVFADFYFWGWKYNQFYIKHGAALLTWDYFILKATLRTLVFASGSLLIWILSFWLIGKNYKTARKTSPHLGFTIAWLAASFVPVFMGGRMFFHYFVQLYPPLCLLAGIQANLIWPRKKLRPLIIGLCLLPMFIFIPLAFIKGHKPNPTAETLENFLIHNAPPDSRIFIWGYLPRTYYFTRLRPASRFVFAQFMTGSTPKTHGMDFDPKAPAQWPHALQRVLMEFSASEAPLRDYDTSENAIPQAWDMLFADFNAHPPLYFIDTAPANIDRYGKYPLSKYPKLQEYVSKHYFPEIILNKIVVYRRVP